MGVGLQLTNDDIGPKSIRSISGAYAYRLRLAKGKLAFGLRAGLDSYRFRWNEIEYKHASDPVPQGVQETFTAFTFDYGMYYHTHTFYAGFELTNLNQSSLGVTDISANDTLEQTARLFSHATATVGKAVELGSKFVFKPSLLLRVAENAPGQFDLNFSVLYDQTMWLGFSWRSDYGLISVVEFNVNEHLRIGYSYDYAFTDVRAFSDGTHEIFVGYDFKIFSSRIVSPRYF